MRRIADLHSGEAKTDARDAAIIAEAVRTLPHALRSLKLADEQIAELSMLCGFDDDLAAQTTQARNRIRGLLTQIPPALERVLGPRLNHPAVLDLLQRYPSPEKLALLGEKKLALQLIALRKQRNEVAPEVEQRVLDHPLYPVLTSMPRVGVRTAARLLTEVACRAFASAAHLAAYAGLAPVTRRSGSSIRGEYPSRRGNKRLKRALIALARRRCDVLFAMIRDGTFYTP